MGRGARFLSLLLPGTLKHSLSMYPVYTQTNCFYEARYLGRFFLWEFAVSGRGQGNAWGDSQPQEVASLQLISKRAFGLRKGAGYC